MKRSILCLCLICILPFALFAACQPSDKNTVSKWNVSFDLNYEGADTPQVVKVDNGKRVEKPADPTRNGYRFEGWFVDKACTVKEEWISNKGITRSQSPVQGITSDTTFYAGWTALSDDDPSDPPDPPEPPASKKLPQSLSVTLKEDIYVGDALNKSLFEVSVTYTDNTNTVTQDFSVQGFDSSSAGNKSLTIVYVENDVTLNETLRFEVKEKAPVTTRTLASIGATYAYPTVAIGAQVSANDFTVTARYSDETSQIVTNFTVSDCDTSTSGEKQVTVSYTENIVTKTTTVTIVVVANTPDPNPEPPQQSSTIYLDVSSITWWENDNPFVYAYIWYTDATNNSWPGVRMTKSGNVYMVEYDKNKTVAGIIFLRVSPAYTGNWDDVYEWNRIELKTEDGSLAFTHATPKFIATDRGEGSNPRFVGNWVAV